MLRYLDHEKGIRKVPEIYQFETALTDLARLVERRDLMIRHQRQENPLKLKKEEI